MIWLIFLCAVFIAAIAGMGYLTVALGRFGWIRTLSGESRARKVVIPLALIAIVFAVCCLAMSLVNGITILLYTIIFFLLFGIVVRIIVRIRGKEPGIYWQGWLALLSIVLFFTVGYYQCNKIWKTEYDLVTDKDMGELKIAMFADSHLGTTFDGEGFARELKVIETQHPDILLIAGDFVDDWSNRSDLVDACEALGESDFKYGVWIAYGNHDEGFFSSRDFTADDMEEIFKENGIHLLVDACQAVDDRFYVAGRKDRILGARMDMDELLKGVDTDKYIIVLDHEPNDYEAEAASKADLVLSGHTHGGQLIPINMINKLFGIDDRIYGHERRNGTDFIVTSGISDWELQFKTGTRSEYVIIRIRKNVSGSSRSSDEELFS